MRLPSEIVTELSMDLATFLYVLIEDVDLKQCFASAYEQIKDRKGYLNATGVFVKDA